MCCLLDGQIKCLALFYFVKMAFQELLYNLLNRARLLFMSFTTFLFESLGMRIILFSLNLNFQEKLTISFLTCLGVFHLWPSYNRFIAFNTVQIGTFCAQTNSRCLIFSSCNTRIAFCWESIITELKQPASMRSEVYFTRRDSNILVMEFSNVF